ncbi:reductive dehalogenase [Dehalogenimonas formicexedens]|uniref:Reductive dehalogenase n=2 Tax=Dehalogenimonas TaxID=670486 RepID=A0A1P8FA25_9CHLR|nr:MULTISPECIES: reductive dehalogenase [Dehalogenimonas]APV45316.1 reductive dehalogenase [Dehalogenimonas formicexedens]KTB49121.1 reductive dehalogenase [Dehalogenimonas alkenigignens]
MSKFHSTVTRRDFMKAIGLAGAGVGAAALANPVFHDLDELGGATGIGKAKRAWWVKEREALDSTTPVDWDIYKRYDGALNTVPFLGNMAPDEAKKLTDETGMIGLLETLQHDLGNTAAMIKFPKWQPGSQHIEAMLNKKPGYSVREFAFGHGMVTWPSKLLEPHAMFMGDSRIMSRIWSPQELGVPPWSGTPEENSALLRTVIRTLGGSTIGFVPLNEKTRRFINTRPIGDPGMRIEFEDVDAPYLKYSGKDNSESKFVIPNKFTTAVTFSWQMSKAIMNVPGMHTAQQSGGTCIQIDVPRHTLLQFFKALGWHAASTDAIGNHLFPPFGVMGGLGEMGRMTMVITPERGPQIRATSCVFTDLPLAYDNPIEFGARRFCFTCKKCADVCPMGAISTEKEPSWDITKKYDNYVQPETFNNAGLNAWYLDHNKCYQGWRKSLSGYCGLCQPNCTFSKFDQAGIHQVIMGTASTTPVFNGFFRKMDDFFGYGSKAKGWGETTQEEIDALMYSGENLSEWGYDGTYGRHRL